MASPRMGPRDWVRSKETKLNSSAKKHVGCSIKEKYVKKAALVVLTRKGKVSRKVRQPLKLTTPPFL